MSAALQLPVVWGAASAQALWPAAATEELHGLRAVPEVEPEDGDDEQAPLPIGLAFYRKHSENMLRRYLYASMQVGRAPSILGDPVARGWASNRPVRTFEDAVIFVLDVETCLNQLQPLDRQLLSRIVLQEYTQAETATMLGMSVRTISYKFQQALDRLTQKLLDYGLLVLPH